MRRMKGHAFLSALVGVVLSVGLAIGSSARANPISTQIVRARQVPKTSHVQITYGTAHKDLPSEVRRDGALLAVTWKELGAFSANTGSGVTTIAAQQLCDCNVPVGTHEYALKLTEGYQTTLKATITVVADYTPPQPRDMGVGRDLMPWDQPEPVDLQGLDCATHCSDVAKTDGPKADGPKADGPKAKGDGPTPSGDTGAVKPVDKDTGCSMSGTPGGPSLLLLAAALLLGGLLVRRRRA